MAHRPSNDDPEREDEIEQREQARHAARKKEEPQVIHMPRRSFESMRPPDTQRVFRSIWETTKTGPVIEGPQCCGD